MSSTQEPAGDPVASALFDAIATVVVLDADLTLEAAVAALVGLDDDATVVVVDRVRRPWVHVPVPVALVRAVAEEGIGPEGGGSGLLRSAVAGWVGAPVAQAEDLSSVGEPGTLVAIGEQIIGLLTSVHSDRSVDRAPAPPALPSLPSLPSSLSTGRFRAFPLIVGPPDVVAPGTPVLLDVGFANPADPTRQAPVGTDPVHFPWTTEQVTFEVHVTGFGLAFPDGTTHPLTVARAAPWATTVSIRVVAEPVPTTTTRTVDLAWFHEGVQVGTSWCDLQVAGPDHTVPPEPVAPVPLGGSTGLDPALAGADTPDLTVTVISEQGSPRLLWQIGSPHPLPPTDGPVISAYPQAEAKAFAGTLMTQMEAEKGQPTLDSVVRSQGEAVTGVIPPAFLAALEAAWAGARRAGREVPTMLLHTDEPWVPWELAWLVPDRDVAADLLPAGSTGVRLGTAWSIGRWPRATRRNHGPALPLTPPAVRVHRAPMAVVVADYTGGVPIALPHAVDEGTHLEQTYEAKRIEIEDAAFTRLMLAEIVEDDGRDFRPHLVHVTAHGDTTVGKNDAGGIKLKSGRFYSPAAVAGAPLGRTSAPLVFVNACRVGTAGEVLNTYGGLPGAFISSGCRGFIAPLWKVDDDVAARLSKEFYAQVLHPDPAQRVPVGEAVRRVRDAYGEGAGGTATPLAYVFYGHPLLRLDDPAADPTQEEPA